MKAVAWLGMSLLALAAAAYSFAILFAPEFRSPFVDSLLAQRPVAAHFHFLGGAIALVAGALQLNRWLRTRAVGTHRWLGRLYVVAVASGGIAAFALALHSFGGLVARAGFGVLAVFWLASTLNGYYYIRHSNPIAHRNWMIRSYALTLAAVTLRLYMPLSQVLGLPAEVAYPAISWLAWVPNLLIAEWFVRSGRLLRTAPDKSRPARLDRDDLLHADASDG